MADQVMTGAVEMDSIIPEIWSAKFYPTLLEKLPFADSVATDYQGEITALGDIVNINQFPQFDIADVILEDEKANADSVTSTKTQLVINKQIVKDYIITKKAMKQSLDAQNELRNLAMHSIMKKIQAIIVAETVPSSTAPDHQIAYDSGTTLALADILEAKELLDLQDTEDVGRILITGAAQAIDLFNITGFTSKDFIPAGSPLTDGAITLPVAGFAVKSSTEVGTTSYFFHPLYLQMAIQQNPDVKVYDLGSDGIRAQRVNIDVLMGAKQISNIRVVTIS